MQNVLDSIFSEIAAFGFRCRNDESYSMESMQGSVETITGYKAEDILENSKVSYVGITYEGDKDRVFGEVDSAIEAGQPWDMFYRIVHADGHLVPVRERGSAIFENGELKYLQGLIVGAQAEVDLRDEMQQLLKGSEAQNEEILKVIGQITRSLRQLNMLSINASVEAARSGEAGRGFAVVATEIKTLATQNSTWAKSISDVIGNRPN